MVSVDDDLPPAPLAIEAAVVETERAKPKKRKKRWNKTGYNNGKPRKRRSRQVDHVDDSSQESRATASKRTDDSPASSSTQGPQSQASQDANEDDETTEEEAIGDEEQSLADASSLVPRTQGGLASLLLRDEDASQEGLKTAAATSNALPRKPVEASGSAVEGRDESLVAKRISLDAGCSLTESASAFADVGQMYAKSGTELLSVL